MKHVMMAALMTMAGMIPLQAGGGDSDLETLATWMTGSFSSEAHAKSDSEIKNITLEMARIWPDRDDGVWLYVEQAAAENKKKPYRQRVYRLTAHPDGSFRSDVYTLPTPDKHVGQYKKDEPLKKLIFFADKIRLSSADAVNRIRKE